MNAFVRREYLRANGYTLVEVLVVVVMVGLMATIAIVQFGGSDEVSRIQNAKMIVIADIARAQSWAQTGKTCCGGSTVPNGYGIMINRNTDAYILYAEMTGNFQYDASTADVTADTIDLSQDELLSRLFFQNCTPLSGSNTCDVYFHYPTGDVYTNGTQTTNLSVTLSHTTRALTQSITVDIRSGRTE